jgi:hypothetical protein
MLAAGNNVATSCRPREPIGEFLGYPSGTLGLLRLVQVRLCELPVSERWVVGTTEWLLCTTRANLRALALAQSPPEECRSHTAEPLALVAFWGHDIWIPSPFPFLVLLDVMR